MARKKAEVEENYNPEDDFSSLLAGTGFSVIKDFKVLNNNRKIPTPIEAINCMLGGGLPFGIVLNSYGRSKTGKSTWLYQMMANFQKKYPDGIAFIIDTETSGDPSRARFFGVDTDKVMIICPPSIESGFLSIMKMLENKTKNERLRDKPVFGIWDSLSNGLAQDNSTQSRMNAQDRARIIKNYMGPLMAEIEKHEFFLGCINQAVVQTDSYGNRKDISGGGVALEHQVHVQTKFSRYNGDVFDGNYITRRTSLLDVDKSKLGPEMKGIAVIMDITRGGMIDERVSFVDYLTSSAGFIPNKQGWYRLDNIIDISADKFYYRMLCDYNKSYRYNDLMELAKSDDNFYNLMKIFFMDKMSSIYKLQELIIKPYLEEVITELRKNVFFPELSIVDDEDYSSRIMSTIDNNPELLSTIKENIDNDIAICLNCGKSHDSTWGCDCNSDDGVVITSELAKTLLASRLEKEDNLDQGEIYEENTDSINSPEGAEIGTDN